MAGREKVPEIPLEGEIPLGSKIRIRRQQLGVGLSEFAQRVGNYHQTHISHLELGTKPVSEEILPKIARALELSPEDLINAPRAQVIDWLADRNKKMLNDKSKIGQKIQLEVRVNERQELLKALQWHAQRVVEISEQITKLDISN